MMLRLFIMWLALVPCVLAGRARAQWEEPEGLRITREAFERHAEALEFTPAQREAAEAMFEEYAREFDDAWKTYCESNEWLWSNASDNWCGGEDEADFNETLRIEWRTFETKWNQGGRAFEAAYFERLAKVAIGREDTVASLERKHLRDRLLRKERLSEPQGVGIDLIIMVESIDPALPFRESLRPILAEYELAIHERLKDYDNASQTWRQRLDNASHARRIALLQGEDTPEAKAAVNDFADVYSERYQQPGMIWRLQEATANRIVTCLSPSEQDAFDDLLQVKLRPFLLPETGPPLEEEFTAALARHDLAADQRARLEELRRTYRTARNAATPSLEAVYMRTVDPALHREYFRLHFGNNREEAKQLYQPVEDAWTRARDGWLQQCDATGAAIRAVVAAAPVESTP